MVQALRSGASGTRTRGFVMVPTRLLYDERLTGDQIRTWAALEDLQRDESHVDATTLALAEVLHCSHDAVQRRINALEAAGWLTVTHRRGLQRANRYTVVGSERRARASSGSRTDARTNASSMEHAPTRDPSAHPRSEEETSSCSNKECTDGWIEVNAEGRFGVYTAAARCPACTPPPF